MTSCTGFLLFGMTCELYRPRIGDPVTRPHAPKLDTIRKHQPKPSLPPYAPLFGSRSYQVPLQEGVTKSHSMGLLFLSRKSFETHDQPRAGRKKGGSRLRRQNCEEVTRERGSGIFLIIVIVQWAAGNRLNWFLTSPC